MATLSVAPWLPRGGLRTAPTPSASLAFPASSRRSMPNSINASKRAILARPALLHCSFMAPSASLSSSFSGSYLGLDISSNIGVSSGRCHRLVVRAGKYTLCQTKRNRSTKSLARTHGFRVRMSTTSGRAVLRRRRAKGRKILCTKSNPNSGKKSSP